MDLFECRLKLDNFGYRDFKRKVPPMPICNTGDLMSVDRNETSYSLRDTVSRMEFREDNLCLATGTVAVKTQKVIGNRSFELVPDCHSAALLFPGHS
jgi:hypothetical protein